MASSSARAVTGRIARTATRLSGIHKIRHVIVIMQENRSFDSYFGTYPGADGIPMKHGRPTVCVPDPTSKRCVAPFHDTNSRNAGGPHEHVDAIKDINHGKMDGFVARERRPHTRSAEGSTHPRCAPIFSPAPDVMGYHDGHEIPNYWALRAPFRPPGSHVPVGHLLEPSLPPLPRLRLVGNVRKARQSR